MATGHEAPWRGSRTTRTSWQKYLPPNCAPMPNSCVSSKTSFSSSTSRNAWAAIEPSVGSAVEIVRGRVLGGLQRELRRRAADHDREVVRRAGRSAERAQLLVEEVEHRLGVEDALVSWYRNDLLADPPPLAMKRNLYGALLRAVAYSSICAGRFVPVFFSSHIVDRRELGVAQVELRVGVDRRPC